MGFFHKEHVVKERKREPMEKYIAPYQFEAVMFEMVNAIAVKVGCSEEILEAINKKYCIKA